MNNIKSKRFNIFTPFVYLPIIISIILFFNCISLFTSDTGYQKYVARVYLTAGWVFFVIGTIALVAYKKMPDTALFKIVIAEYLALIFIISMIIIAAPRGFGVIRYYDNQISDTERVSYFWANPYMFNSNLANFFNYKSFEFGKETRHYRLIYIGDRKNPSTGYQCLSDVINSFGVFLTSHKYNIPKDINQALQYLQQNCYQIPSDQLKLMKIARNGEFFPILE